MLLVVLPCDPHGLERSQGCQNGPVHATTCSFRVIKESEHLSPQPQFLHDNATEQPTHTSLNFDQFVSTYPPIQVENLRSGDAEMRILTSRGASRRTSLSNRSPYPAYTTPSKRVKSPLKDRAEEARSLKPSCIIL